MPTTEVCKDYYDLLCRKDIMKILIYSIKFPQNIPK